mmetsp:Transcript_89300/g.130619  ORF Transcript_89300/g.130619 Transcript_89300/m.130619 type:complete len:85 (-) Transcript_89300:238-492(-)
MRSCTHGTHTQMHTHTQTHTDTDTHTHSRDTHRHRHTLSHTHMHEHAPFYVCKYVYAISRVHTLRHQMRTNAYTQAYCYDYETT